MMDQILRFISVSDANVRYVLIGSMLLGMAAGIIGTFALLRKRSLLGDALAHAALPGVGLGFLLTLSKSIVPLFIGASIAGILGVLTIIGITRTNRIKQDAAIGITLSVYFGAGIVLLTYIQRLPSGNQSGLDKFLFGQAASMLPSDIMMMSIVSLLVILIVIALFKEFRLLIFDQAFLATLGYPVHILDILLMVLVVFVVMIGLQAVGVVLMAALLITPAAGARFWTENLRSMIILAAVFGAFSGVVGTFLSSLAPRIPTGPVMVLAATMFFVISAVSAPRRGLAAKLLQLRHNRRKMQQEHFLRAAIEWLELHHESKAIPLKAFIGRTEMPISKLKRVTAWLIDKRMIKFSSSNHIQLTQKGYDKALQIVKSHRLWEYYLLYRMQLQEDHLHRDADEIEHILTPDLIDQIEKILQNEGVDTSNVVSVHPLHQ
ncbi:MAG: iron chelate uptake ABC transporter family permease subunit [Caldithrix sp.]|nr:iron chelate uptake ABC transporter family permease subunit [Caldithrix sp.]